MADAPKRSPLEIAPGVPRAPKVRPVQPVQKAPPFVPKAKGRAVQGAGPVSSSMGTAANIVQGPQQMAPRAEIATQTAPPMPGRVMITGGPAPARELVAQGARQLAAGGAPAPASLPFGLVARLIPRVRLAPQPSPAPPAPPAPLEPIAQTVPPAPAPSSGEPTTRAGKAKTKGGK